MDLEGGAKAYDGNALMETGSIRDRVGEKDFLLLLNQDTQSFAVYEIPQNTKAHLWAGDTLFLDSSAYSFTGKSLDPSQPNLKCFKASQEFWHSWRTFRPDTERFQ